MHEEQKAKKKKKERSRAVIVEQFVYAFERNFLFPPRSVIELANSVIHELRRRESMIVYACISIIARSSEVVLQETGSHSRNASRLHGKIDYRSTSLEMDDETLGLIGPF